MLKLSQRLIVIDNGTDFKGILHCSILRVLDKFCFELKLRKFKVISDEIFKTVKNEINKNSFDRLDLVDKIDNDILFTHLMTVHDCEQYSSFLGKQIKHIITNDKNINDNNYYRFIIDNVLKVILTLNQAKKLFSDLQAFVSNYMILDSMYRLLNPQIQVQDESAQNIIIDNNVKDNIIDTNLQATHTDSFLDDVLNLCINNVVRSYILHETISYFSLYSAAIKKEDNIITIPGLFKNSQFYPSSYLKSLIISLSTIEHQTLDHFIELTLSYLQNNNDNVKIFIATFILFIYYLVKTYQTHPINVQNELEIWISKTDTQKKLLNHYSPNIKFDIVQTDVIDNNDTIISEISSKHQYLLRLSENEFCNTVFNEVSNIDNKIPVNFNLSHPIVINIEKFFNTKSFLTSYTHFEDNPEIITLAYRTFIGYTTSTNNISKETILNNATNIPVSVVKLFPLLSTSITTLNFNKDISDTLKYYTIICSFLKDPSIFNHIDILYIVFQIIIPYYYHMYNQTIYTDYFLAP